ncbi:MAG: TIGR03557 family F420-dependent LLM class oxidoreductase [Actinomycetes bacterium]
MRVGFFLSTEEYTPRELLDQAQLAERAGFDALWISDHFHPWNDAQGQSPFVWSIIGALSQVSALPVSTAVTCPTVRIHPAVIAQAAATSAVLHDGRFVLGVGTGEALNEHVLGDAWPNIDVRLEMLEEAVSLMRELWAGGFVTRHGRHYTVENARIYTRPDKPPPVYVSAFGPKAVDVAARIGDGFVTASPDADLIRRFRVGGGDNKPVQGGMKACVVGDEATSRKTTLRLWPNTGVPGELAQVLPSPRHFEQAAQLVTEHHVAQSVVCGPDAEAHRSRVREYVDAGCDEVYVACIGEDYRDFFELYRDDVLPHVKG